jgi:hypothetical protein
MALDHATALADWFYGCSYFHCFASGLVGVSIDGVRIEKNRAPERGRNDNSAQRGLPPRAALW